MEGQEGKPSFWERLGRGVAQGWEKAKETSGRIGREAGLKLDLHSARAHLEDRYRLLGRIAAERLLDRGEPALEGAEEAVRHVLEEVRAARDALRVLEESAEGRTPPGEGPEPPARGAPPPEGPAEAR